MPAARESAPIESRGPEPDCADSIPVFALLGPRRDDNASAARRTADGRRRGRPRTTRGRPAGPAYLGINTESITWMTPLLASTSVLTTFASSTLTPPAVAM